MKFKFVEDTTQLSTMCGITSERGDYLRACLMFYTLVFMEGQKREGIRSINSGLVFDYALECTLEKVDQSNTGELIYFGSKVGEFMDELGNGDAARIAFITKQLLKAGDGSEEDLINRIASQLKHK